MYSDSWSSQLSLAINFLSLCVVSLLTQKLNFLFLIRLPSTFMFISICSWMVTTVFEMDIRGQHFWMRIIGRHMNKNGTSYNVRMVSALPAVRSQHNVNIPNHRAETPPPSHCPLPIITVDTYFFELMVWSHKQILSFIFTEHHWDCLLECLWHLFYLGLLGYYYMVRIFSSVWISYSVCWQFTTLNKFWMLHKCRSNYYLQANTKHQCYYS